MVNITEEFKQALLSDDSQRRIQIVVENETGKPNIPNITPTDIYEQEFTLSESLCSQENLRLGICEASYIEFKIHSRAEDFKGRWLVPYLYVDGMTYTDGLKLGRFKVSEVDVEHKIGFTFKTITAYDPLADLEINAKDWYDRYMYGYNVEDFYLFLGQFDYSRQIYSAYSNIAKRFGIQNDLDIISKTQIGSTFSYYGDDVIEGKDILLTTANCKIQLCSKEIAINDIYDAYCVEWDSRFHGATATPSLQDSWNEYAEVDSLFRGVCDSGLMIKFLDSSDNVLGTCLIDNGDYFLVPTGTVKLEIKDYAWATLYNTALQSLIVENLNYDLKVYGLMLNSKPKDIANAGRTLPYFKFAFRTPSVTDILEVDSGITARDVLSSILEMTGCMFRLDRNGIPSFKYNQRGTLFPSLTIYPSTSLYPIGDGGSSMEQLPMAKYISCISEDYEVQSYGRIQVVSQDTSNEKTIRWEYVGVEDSPSAYVIEENIFLCNKDMKFDLGATGNLVDEILFDMYEKVSNFEYTPHETKAVGLPWLECGDRIVVVTPVGSFESFIFNRRLTGIIALRDTLEATGNEYTPKVTYY